MARVPAIPLFTAVLALLGLCSCEVNRAPLSKASPAAPLVVASGDMRATQWPRDIAMNKDAGRGNELFVTVRLGNGEKLPFIIDTGAGGTLFDKSLEPQLGKCLGQSGISLFGVRSRGNVYSAPAMSLGKTPLMMTGPAIVTYDLKSMSTNTARPVKGILGMDVLAHYCLQLDFQANKIRFLDDRRADKSRWGKAFPLINAGDGCFFINDNFAGASGPGSLIDTGCTYDGWLQPELYRQWTNQSPLMMNGSLYPHYSTLGGETYPQVYLTGLASNLVSGADIHLTLNGIGLQFLSRNLVTLDFPQMTMYLKRTSAGRLVDKQMRRTARFEGKSAFIYLVKLQKKGELPGWSKDDELPENQIHFLFRYPDVVTFDDVVKGWDQSVYHYELFRSSPHGPWKLVKAWETAPGGRTVREFPVP